MKHFDSDTISHHLEKILEQELQSFPLYFQPCSQLNAQSFSTSETSGEILGMKAENKVGNKAGQTAIRALESFLINEILYQSQNVLLPNL